VFEVHATFQVPEAGIVVEALEVRVPGDPGDDAEPLLDAHLEPMECFVPIAQHRVELGEP
jgi:hypothetical protein